MQIFFIMFPIVLNIITQSNQEVLIINDFGPGYSGKVSPGKL